LKAFTKNRQFMVPTWKCNDGKGALACRRAAQG